MVALCFLQEAFFACDCSFPTVSFGLQRQWGNTWSLLGSSIQLLPLRTKQCIPCSEMDAADLSCLLFHLEANRYTISCSVNLISFNETSLSRLSVLTGDDGVFNDEFQTGKHSTVHWFKEPPTPAHLFIGLCFTSEDTHLNSFTGVQ